MPFNLETIKNLLNRFFTSTNDHIDRSATKIEKAIVKNSGGAEVTKAVGEQTSALKIIFSKFDKVLEKFSNPKIDVTIDFKPLQKIFESISKAVSTIATRKEIQLDNIEASLKLMLISLGENKPESMVETFDAFGKKMLELKPKDQVTINPKQIDGLMMAIVNSGGRLPAPNGGLYSGRKVVTTAGTAVKLQTTQEQCENITITAESDNTGIIAVGDSSVVAAEGTQQGAILTPLGSITVKVGDLSKIYIDSDVNGDGVSYAYER